MTSLHPVRSATCLGLAVVAALVTACDQPSELETLPHPVPVTRSVSPDVLSPDGSPVQLEVRGLGFTDATVAEVGGRVETTALLDSFTIAVSVASGPSRTSGDSVVLVLTNPQPGGGVSEPLILRVSHPVPTVTSVESSDSTAVLATRLSLVVAGSGFASEASVLWNGAPIPTSFQSPERLDASVPDYLLRAATSAEISVRNPPPGGGTAAATAFSTLNPRPEVSAVDPVGVRLGEGGDVRIVGVGFAATVTLSLDGTDREIVLESDSVVHVTVPASMALRGDTVSIVVTNPAPGGGTSTPWALPVWERPPVLDEIAPRWAHTNDPPFAMELEGEDFAPDATVLWGGVPHAFTFLGDNRLEVPVDASDLAVIGDVDIQVVNPREGGPSTSHVFTVLPPFTLPTDLFLSEALGGISLTTSQLDGSDAQTFPTPELAFRPDPRPGFDEVAYHRQGVIYVRDLTTDTEVQLLPDTIVALFSKTEWPRYSPDGAWIYFTGESIDDSAVWRVRPDGSDAEPLFTTTPWTTRWGTPSSSGTKISLSDRDLALWTYDLVTFEVTSIPMTWAHMARWSPDDEWIAYTQPTGRLYVVRSDGTESGGRLMPGIYGPVFDWLPDGRIVAVTGSEGQPVVIDPNLGKVDTLPALQDVGSIVRWRNQ